MVTNRLLCDTEEENTLFNLLLSTTLRHLKNTVTTFLLPNYSLKLCTELRETHLENPKKKICILKVAENNQYCASNTLNSSI